MLDVCEEYVDETIPDIRKMEKIGGCGLGGYGAKFEEVIPHFKCEKEEVDELALERKELMQLDAKELLVEMVLLLRGSVKPKLKKKKTVDDSVLISKFLKAVDYVASQSKN